MEEQTADEGYLKDHLNDKDKVDAKSVAARLKVLKKADPKGEEYAEFNVDDDALYQLILDVFYEEVN